jgi:hypothetical protein
MRQSTVSELIDEALGGASSLAGELDLPVTTVASWKARGKIPVEYWPGVIAVARRRGRRDINGNRLIAMHATSRKTEVA